MLPALPNSDPKSSLKLSNQDWLSIYYIPDSFLGSRVTRLNKVVAVEKEEGKHQEASKQTNNQMSKLTCFFFFWVIFQVYQMTVWAQIKSHLFPFQIEIF